MSLKRRCPGTEKRKDGWTLISNSYSQEATNSRCRILEMDIFFTWILHQITMYSNEVKRAAGSNNDSPLSTPHLPHPFDEQKTNKKVSC